MESVDGFDPAKGASFEQYVWTRISGALVDDLRRQDWASRSVRRAGKQIEGARDSCFARSGTIPTEPELAGALGITVSELRDDLEDIDRADVASLNAPARATDDSPVEIGENVESPRGEDEPGRLLGVSESRISQILTVIRHKLSHQLDSYDAGRLAAERS